MIFEYKGSVGLREVLFIKKCTHFFPRGFEGNIDHALSVVMHNSSQYVYIYFIKMLEMQ